MSSKPGFAPVEGARLAYFSEGGGPTVVFVHGVVSDHRFWSRQLRPLSAHFRCIAIDQRYFGQSRSEGSKPYALATHAMDLSAFVDALECGPVHVVATSYGSAVALASAAATPDRFASLFLNEPTLSSLVTDPESQAILARERRELGAAAAAVAAGNDCRAVELFCDWTAFPGAFETLPPDLQEVFHDSAATVRLLFAAPAPSVTPADLEVLRMPVTLTTGGRTRPFFRVQTAAAHRCIAHSRLLTFPAAHHAASFECVDDFNRAVLEHVAGVSAAA